jgi:nitrogen fixation NifU-like protein
MYNNIIQDCFFQTRHNGVIELDDPQVVYYRGCQSNQVIIDLYVRLNKNGLIPEARFKAKGNPYVIATMEWLCRRVEGSEFKALPELSCKILIEELGIPHRHYPIAVLIEDVYQEILVLMKKKFKG